MIVINQVIKCKHDRWSEPDRERQKCKSCGVQMSIAEFVIFKKLRDVQDSLRDLRLELERFNK